MSQGALRRGVTFRLYPTRVQEEKLVSWLRLHAELYNAAIEERRGAYRKAGENIFYRDQQNQLPEIVEARPELKYLGSHALQATLRRVDEAFQRFFARGKRGEGGGYPKFKSWKSLGSFTFPDVRGWKLRREAGLSRRTLRIHIGTRQQKGAGEVVGWVRARGLSRFDWEMKQAVALTVRRDREGQWHATVTVALHEEQIQRTRSEDRVRGMDLGLDNLVTFDDGEVVENPRWLREGLRDINRSNRSLARKRRGSLRYRREKRRLGRLHQKVAACRKDDLEKLTTRIAETTKLLATEQLTPERLSRMGHSGLRREIRSAAWGYLLRRLQTKMEEARGVLREAETRVLKPSQRCSGCWRVRKKTLSERVHACSACGLVRGRDENAALVCLLDALGLEPGTGSAASSDTSSGDGFVPEGEGGAATREASKGGGGSLLRRYSEQTPTHEMEKNSLAAAGCTDYSSWEESACAPARVHAERKSSLPISH